MQVLRISPSTWKQESLENPPVGDYHHTPFLERLQFCFARNSQLLLHKKAYHLLLNSDPPGAWLWLPLTSSPVTRLSLFFLLKPHTLLLLKHSMCASSQALCLMFLLFGTPFLRVFPVAGSLTFFSTFSNVNFTKSLFMINLYKTAIFHFPGCPSPLTLIFFFYSTH